VQLAANTTFCCEVVSLWERRFAFLLNLLF